MKVCLWGAALVFLAALFYYAFRAPFSTRVLSSSMEPTLYGPRWEPLCPRCGNLFIFSVNEPSREKIASVRFASCPLCGFSEIPLNPKELRKGDRVRVERRVVPSPRRWEVVAWRSDGGLSVKRVAGLPGEEIELRRGTLYVDGRPVPKPQDRWSRVPLNTDRKAVSGRLLVLNRLPCPLLDGEGERADSYHPPITNAPTSLPFDEPKKIEFVNDYSVEFPSRLLDGASLIVNQGDRAWHIARAEAGRLALRRIDLPEDRSPEEDMKMSASDFGGTEEIFAELPESSGELTVSCADALLRIFAGPTCLFSLPNPPIAEKSRPVVCPLIVLTETPEEHIPARIRVWRDVGYGSLSPRRLGDDEYFLLGDNPAFSVDSRDAGDPVRARQLHAAVFSEREL